MQSDLPSRARVEQVYQLVFLFEFIMVVAGTRTQTLIPFSQCHPHCGESFMNSNATPISIPKLTRRDVLHLGAAGLITSTCLGSSESPVTRDAFRCIFINLVGGPSHIDTWDPKPNAPLEYRGPFKAIRTSIPGMQFTELFPRLAQQAHLLAVVRSVFHQEPPIHETGLQLVQQGKLGQSPHVVKELPAKQESLLIPRQIENTGVELSRGQDGFRSIAPSTALRLGKETNKMQEAYGQHAFGQSCLLARQAIEQGHQHVVINMFNTVYDSLSWDCHADGASLNTTLQDYKNTVAPMFDATFTTLIADLEQRGLLSSTLVVACGEFGRSPKINLRGGRDHWTGVWSVLFAGGGVRGGQVIGSSDRLGMEPASRPVHASAIANTVRYAAGLRTTTAQPYGEPITELFSSRSSS